MDSMKETVEELARLVEKHAPEIREISDFIHSHPELGYQEFEASRKIAGYMESQGFEVDRKIGGLETAFRARFRNGSDPGTPCVCIPAEYDALEGFGHGCGHNLIASCSIAAALGAADYAKKHDLPLNLWLMGTPAEEGFGGKIALLGKGAFEGVDMAVMAHPSSRTITEAGALGVTKANISFFGKASHAGAAPEKGINALDAMAYFYMDMLGWKKDIGPRERVHGIITKGGDAANIIPELTTAFFYVRAPKMAALNVLKEKLEKSVRFGAEKTGCRFKVEWISTYMPILCNHELSVHFKNIWHEMGEEIPLLTGNENTASTDMGDVTQAVPGAHFHFNIFDGEKYPLHSFGFRDAAGRDFGFKMALRTGVSLAALALDFTFDAAFREQVRKDFAEASGH